MAAARSDDLGKLLLRIGIGVVLLFHGVFKIMHGVGWLKGLLEAHGWPGFLIYGPYLAEVVAPALIIIGIRTRLGALVVVFNMIAAFVLVLGGQVFIVKEGGGGWAIELEVLLLLCSLTLFFIGGGRYGITKGKSAWD